MLEPRRDLVVADKVLDQIFGVEICCAFHQRRRRNQKEKRPALRCRFMADRVPWDVVERPALPRRCAGPPAVRAGWGDQVARPAEHTSELQSRRELVCRLLLEKKKRLNSRPVENTYAVFCLKKKNTQTV